MTRVALLLRRCAAAAGFAAALVFALPSVPVLACSCVAGSAADHFRRSDTIFAGRVVNVDMAPVPDGPAVPASREQTVTFEVRSIYKGSPPAEAIVTAETGGASCGFPFAETASYLVFARAAGEAYSTSYCAGTTDDLTYLDRAGFTAHEVSITVPSGAAGPAAGGGARTSWIVAAGVALALAFGAHARRFVRLRASYSRT